jgi:hypothetical protein
MTSLAAQIGVAVDSLVTGATCVVSTNKFKISSPLPGVGGSVAISAPDTGISLFDALDTARNATQAGPTSSARVVYTYTASVLVDGLTTKAISITGHDAQTYTALLSELQTDLDVGTHDATPSLSALGGTGTGNNLIITSDLTGITSSIAITDGVGFPLFGTLTGFVGIEAAVPGITGTAVPVAGYDYVTLELGSAYDANATGLVAGSTYTATIVVDGVSKSISVAGVDAPTLADLLTEIDTDLAAAATCSLVGNTIRVTSATTGAASSVVITDITLFKALRNFSSNSPGAVGTAVDHYMKVDLGTSGKVLVSEWAAWDAGTHVGTGETVTSRHTVNIGDRPGSMYVFSFANKRPPLYIFN